MNDSSDDSMDLQSIRLSDIQALNQSESKPKKKERTKTRKSNYLLTYAETKSFSDDSNSPDNKIRPNAIASQHQPSSSSRQKSLNMTSGTARRVDEDDSSSFEDLQRSRYCYSRHIIKSLPYTALFYRLLLSKQQLAKKKDTEEEEEFKLVRPTPATTADRTNSVSQPVIFSPPLTSKSTSQSARRSRSLSPPTGILASPITPISPHIHINYPPPSSKHRSRDDVTLADKLSTINNVTDKYYRRLLSCSSLDDVAEVFQTLNQSGDIKEYEYSICMAYYATRDSDVLVSISNHDLARNQIPIDSIDELRSKSSSAIDDRRLSLEDHLTIKPDSKVWTMLPTSFSTPKSSSSSLFIQQGGMLVDVFDSSMTIDNNPRTRVILFLSRSSSSPSMQEFLSRYCYRSIHQLLSFAVSTIERITNSTENRIANALEEEVDRYRIIASSSSDINACETIEEIMMVAAELYEELSGSPTFSITPTFENQEAYICSFPSSSSSDSKSTSEVKSQFLDKLWNRISSTSPTECVRIKTTTDEVRGLDVSFAKYFASSMASYRRRVRRYTMSMNEEVISLVCYPIVSPDDEVLAMMVMVKEEDETVDDHLYQALELLNHQITSAVADNLSKRCAVFAQQLHLASDLISSIIHDHSHSQAFPSNVLNDDPIRKLCQSISSIQQHPHLLSALGVDRIRILLSSTYLSLLSQTINSALSTYYHVDELAVTFTANLADGNILDGLAEDKAVFLHPKMNDVVLSSLVKNVFGSYQNARSSKSMTMILPVTTPYGRIILFFASSPDAHSSSITHSFDFQALFSIGFVGRIRETFTSPVKLAILQTKLLANQQILLDRISSMSFARDAKILKQKVFNSWKLLITESKLRRTVNRTHKVMILLRNIIDELPTTTATDAFTTLIESKLAQCFQGYSVRVQDSSDRRSSLPLTSKILVDRIIDGQSKLIAEVFCTPTTILTYPASSEDRLLLKDLCTALSSIFSLQQNLNRTMFQLSEVVLQSQSQEIMLSEYRGIIHRFKQMLSMRIEDLHSLPELAAFLSLRMPEILPVDNVHLLIEDIDASRTANNSAVKRDGVDVYYSHSDVRKYSMSQLDAIPDYSQTATTTVSKLILQANPMIGLLCIHARGCDVKTTIGEYLSMEEMSLSLRHVVVCTIERFNIQAIRSDYHRIIHQLALFAEQEKDLQDELDSSAHLIDSFTTKNAALEEQLDRLQDESDRQHQHAEEILNQTIMDRDSALKAKDEDIANLNRVLVQKVIELQSLQSTMSEIVLSHLKLNSRDESESWLQEAAHGLGIRICRIIRQDSVHGDLILPADLPISKHSLQLLISESVKAQTISEIFVYYSSIAELKQKASAWPEGGFHILLVPNRVSYTSSDAVACLFICEVANTSEKFYESIKTVLELISQLTFHATDQHAQAEDVTTIEESTDPMGFVHRIKQLMQIQLSLWEHYTDNPSINLPQLIESSVSKLFSNSNNVDISSKLVHLKDSKVLANSIIQHLLDEGLSIIDIQQIQKLFNCNNNSSVSISNGLKLYLPIQDYSSNIIAILIIEKKIHLAAELLDVSFTKQDYLILETFAANLYPLLDKRKLDVTMEQTRRDLLADADIIKVQYQAAQERLISSNIRNQQYERMINEGELILKSLIASR
jgi:hypothetical protein